jgi:hypothetical protein
VRSRSSTDGLILVVVFGFMMKAASDAALHTVLPERKPAAPRNESGSQLNIVPEHSAGHLVDLTKMVWMPANRGVQSVRCSGTIHQAGSPGFDDCQLQTDAVPGWFCRAKGHSGIHPPPAEVHHNGPVDMGSVLDVGSAAAKTTNWELEPRAICAMAGEVPPVR